ncbi:cytochrome o ubiquinol oxidase subunit IV [Saccharicrinis sp. FJH2]|uniref:cytochrome o ubiquinol oxidase subunit IV n=1 Tax=Saccharicrinis sp. FJH65 TaxID=3344659 RepID=UPI0035F427AC
MTKKYILGFILAFLLTGTSFLLAATGMVSKQIIIAGILIAAVAQMLVHLHFFLHLDTSSGARWNVYSLLFAFLLIAFFIGGTIWVMFTLNQRMM